MILPHFSPGILWWLSGKEYACQRKKTQETQVQSLRWEDSLGEGNHNLLQYSCQDNPMDRGTWWAAVHRGRKSQTRTTKWLQLSSDSKLLIAVSFYIIREKSGKEFRCMFSIHQILFISLFCISIQVLPHFRQRKQINSFLCDFSLFSLVFSLIWAYSLPN